MWEKSQKKKKIEVTFPKRTEFFLAGMKAQTKVTEEYSQSYR
jgi:hypothetical protein